jgi:hypothetical protein
MKIDEPGNNTLVELHRESVRKNMGMKFCTSHKYQ